MRWILQNATQNFHVRILPSRERRQYNLSIASEIFSMINADELSTGGNHDIVIQKTNMILLRLDKTHTSYAITVSDILSI